MEEIIVAVVPLKYPLTHDNVMICYNCGSNLFRLHEVYGVLKEEFFKEREEEYGDRMCLVDLTYTCAICGTENGGHMFAPYDQVEKQFDSIDDARSYWRHYLSQQISQRKSGGTLVAQENVETI